MTDLFLVALARILGGTMKTPILLIIPSVLFDRACSISLVFATDQIHRFAVWLDQIELHLK